MKTVRPGFIVAKPLSLLAECRGHYSCPKDVNGKRLGPLVGYAGKYTGADGKEHQWVGDEYLNFAMAERHLPVLSVFAAALYGKLVGENYFDGRNFHSADITGFCGAPEGGKALAVALAGSAQAQYIYPEKKVRAVATAEMREQSRLVFERHEPGRDERWLIVEDMCNNFSTTAEMVTLIESFGATVAGVVCFLNRSLEVDTKFVVPDGRALPVIALVRQKIMQYKQDDPEVALDIAAGNVILKPKIEWSRLEEAMLHTK